MPKIRKGYGNWQLATGCWQLAIGGLQLATGDWIMAFDFCLPSSDFGHSIDPYFFYFCHSV